jgi:hypothetical protein
VVAPWSGIATWEFGSGPGSVHGTGVPSPVPVVESTAGSMDAASVPAEKATAPASLSHNGMHRERENGAMRRRGVLLLVLSRSVVAIFRCILSPRYLG